MDEQRVWNAVFLLDKKSPSKIVLLKRSADKKYAANFYTGVGGKLDPGETVEESAYRELKEETGLENIKLTEFARCIIDQKYLLVYFWGIYNNELPKSDDGELSWVNVENVLGKEIIPTTKEVCNEWSKRKFNVDKPFTLFVTETGKWGTVRKVKVLKAENDLLEL